MDSFRDILVDVERFFRANLPLQSTVLILAVLLLIILFAPFLFRKFRIPGIIGLLISGILIGPNCLHIIEPTNSPVHIPKIGMLYIMFLAGLEIDMQEFRQNRNKGLVFGALTFLIPICTGYFVCIYLLNLPVWPAVLVASMFSTHTLISYPIVSNMGIVKNRAVQVTFGGTIITDSAVLILLGVVTNIVTGELDSLFWLKITFSIGLLLFSTLYLLPRISRWFFRHVEAQAGSHYIFVLAMVFTSGFISEVAGVEPIIGAFLAGLGLNKIIPHSGVLMNRIKFTGNSFFIPFFLVSAGMPVDLRIFFKGSEALVFAGVMTVVGLITKYAASHLTGFFYKYSRAEKNIMFGLSVSHAAATLAIINVGYELGLFDQNVMNGTIILILMSCLISSFVTEKAAREIAISEKEVSRKSQDRNERILIPVSNPENIQRLIDLALMLKDENSQEPLYPLSIVEDNADADEKINVVKKVVEGVADQITGVDRKVEVLKKVDLSIVDGIVRTARAYNISDIIISYKAQQAGSQRFFGTVADGILAKSKQSVIISKILQPLNTFKRILVVLTPNAELEKGFKRSAGKIGIMLKQPGAEVIIHGTSKTLDVFREEIGDKKGVYYFYKALTDFDASEPAAGVQDDDLYIILNARRQTLSYNYQVDEMSKRLNRNSEFASYVVFYPEIPKTRQEERFDEVNTPVLGERYDKVKQLTSKIGGLFRKEGDEEPPGVAS